MSRWCRTPAYPVYEIGTMFAGGESYALPLLEENGFLPDLDAIPADVAARAKMLWLNYPNNPTGAVADIDFFERVVRSRSGTTSRSATTGRTAKWRTTVIAPVSFLEAPGREDVGIEFHSLSKSYNMTGWRIGMAVGQPADRSMR